MFSSTQPVSLGYLPDHLASHAARSRRASGRSGRSYSQRSSCRQSSSTRARYVVERVPQEVHVTALIGRLRQNLAAWLAKWSGKYPKLTGWVEEYIDETLTFYRLPRQRHSISRPGWRRTALSRWCGAPRGSACPVRTRLAAGGRW